MSRNYFWDQLRSAKCLVNVKTFSVLMSCLSQSCHSAQRASCRNCSGLSTFHIHTQIWALSTLRMWDRPISRHLTCKYDTNFSSAQYFYRKMFSEWGRTLPPAIKMPLKIWHFHITVNFIWWRFCCLLCDEGERGPGKTSPSCNWIIYTVFRFVLLPWSR